MFNIISICININSIDINYHKHFIDIINLLILLTLLI